MLGGHWPDHLDVLMFDDDYGSVLDRKVVEGLVGVVVVDWNGSLGVTGPAHGGVRSLVHVLGLVIVWHVVGLVESRLVGVGRQRCCS